MKIRTYDFQTVQAVWECVNTQLFQQTKYYPYQKEFEKKGIKIIFQKEHKGEAVYLIFSPHKQFNGNEHNANSFSLTSAQKIIIDVLASFGISFSDFNLFKVTRLEVGVNYKTHLSSDIVLSSFLMFKTSFFHTHEKHEHYRFANFSYRTNSLTKKRTPNQTMKHYLKDMQDYGNGKTNAEMGFCEPDVVRTEMKTERAGKVKEIGFDKLSDLYRDNALECCINFLLGKLEKVFVFNPKEIDTRKINTKPKYKQYCQMITSNYWQSIKGVKLTRDKSRWQELPKKYDTKQIVIDAISNAIREQNYPKNECKTCSTLHPRELVVEKPATLFINSALQEFINLCYSIDVVNRDTFYCMITGEDISMQRIGRPYLKRDGLRALQKKNPRRFLQLRDKFLPPEFLNQSEYKQLERIEKNIKNRYNNEKHKKISMIQRNYHPNQLQLF